MHYFVKKIIKTNYIMIFEEVPTCPYCGDKSGVIDNGDGWYCEDCNAAFGWH